MATIPKEWQSPDETPIDFIVVGAGAAGAPLAARLVERGYTVLVAEMGPESPPKSDKAVVENTEVPLLHGETTEDERHSLRFFVKHFDDDPEKSRDPKVERPENARRDEQGIFYPRAQGVGGCTIHNAMITVCGPAEDWDEIADATGDKSWQGERMRAYFERVEHCHYATASFWGRCASLLGIETGWEKARHGTRGWLDTTMADLRLVQRDRQLLNVVLDGALGSLKGGVESLENLVWAALSGGTSPSLDPNHWDGMRQNAEGVRRVPCAITPGGERSGPRDRLLAVKADAAHGKRLHLLTGVCVTKIEIRSAPTVRAIGIRCLSRDHVYEADPNAVVMEDSTWRDQEVPVYCRREVILCGGTFNTPQLLMLSGIGPKEHLKEHKIPGIGAEKHPDEPKTEPVYIDLPGVGANLQDRYEVPVIATIADRYASLDGVCMSSEILDPELKKWIDRRGSWTRDRGLYATNGGLVSIFKRSTQEDGANPDLVILALAGHFPGYYLGWSKPRALLGLPNGTDIKSAPRRALTWLILKARTRNRDGYVRLQNAHPFRRPEINFCSFPQAPANVLAEDAVSTDKDLEALFEGVNFVREIMKAGMASGKIEKHELPGLDTFGGSVRRWIRNVAWGHHACGTCQIGAADDPDAVLDSRFRVRDVQGLRVVDASAFPRIPGFFIVTNVYMIAEKAADVLTEDHPRQPEEIPAACQDALKLDPVLPSSSNFETRRQYPAELEAVEARLIADRRKSAGL